MLVLVSHRWVNLTTVQGDCTLEQKPVPADAADQILITEDLLPGQCVIYGIGRILTILVEVSTWVEGIVAAQEVPTKELFGDGGGSGAYVLSLEKGSLYLTQSAVISKLGVQHDPDTPSLLPALQIGYEARAAYIEGIVFISHGGHAVVRLCERSLIHFASRENLHTMTP